MIKDKRIALAFRVAALLIATTGLMSMTGVFRGEPQPRILIYYTTQSNILAIALFVMLTARTAFGLREGGSGNAGYFARFEMVCVIDILLTLMVYWILLAPELFSTQDEYALWTFDNLAVHGITPLLCLLDYILFTQPHHLKYRDVRYVVIYPLIYCAATSLAGLLGYVYRISPSDGRPVRVPYFFYDFDRIGILALAYIAGIVVFFLLLSHGFYLVDKKLRKPHDQD
jgi:hypothetical protein